MSEQMLDCVGVPEFFVTHVGAVEYAECGNVRIIRCIKRGGVMVPVFSLVTPLETIIIASQQLHETALSMFNQERMVGARH